MEGVLLHSVAACFSLSLHHSLALSPLLSVPSIFVLSAARATGIQSIARAMREVGESSETKPHPLTSSIPAAHNLTDHGAECACRANQSRH
ncbi:hypothetical protein WR25_22793 [Diploscapter pachys]|uniref:Uncharacterized protein n=1 Tax=Diploscapter pachys TaxID=2018661 RepID=A0A2A2JJN5_9BILA|nr:hypothetical protein WR25_22793 [Diploscapter pachys]